MGPLYGPHRLFSYYGLSWPVSKSLEHDYVRSGVSQPEIEGDIRSSLSLPSVRFFPQTILICLENNNAACGIPACLTLGCIGSQARYFRGQLSSLLSMIDCRHNSVRYTKNTKTKRRKARIAYYSKSIATYQLLMACGDVHPQPGPVLKKAFDAVCFKTVITRLYHLCFQRVFLNG